MSSEIIGGNKTESTDGTQPTAHEVVPGCSLDRRTFMRSTAATGAAITVAGTGTMASTGMARAQVGGPIGVGWNAGGALRWLFGSGDDDDDEFEEYLGEEKNRLHADIYEHALHSYAGTSTTLTWFGDNAQLLEGRAFIRSLLDAYDVIHDSDGSNKEDAIDAALDAVDDIYSTPERELIEEFHRENRAFTTYFQRFFDLADDSEEIAVDDLVNEIVNFEFEGRSTDGDSQVVEDIEIPAQDNLAQYELSNGDAIDRETWSFYQDDDGGGSTGYQHRDWGTIYPFLQPLTGAEMESGDDWRMDYFTEGSTGSAGDETNYQVLIEVQELDEDALEEDNEIEVDGTAMLIDYEQWMDAAEALEDARTSVRQNTEEFIDQAYEDILEGDLSREDIQSLETMVEDLSDEEPLAWANTHLALLGNSPAAEYTTIEFGALTEEYDNGEDMEDDLTGVEMDGSLHVEGSLTEPLEVGETYTPEDLETVVYMTYTEENDDGEEEIGFIELEDNREFTILDAERLDEDGELVEVDEVSFSDATMPTETPTDYTEMHERLDQTEEFQQEIIDQQRELVEELSEEDEQRIGLPGWGDIGDGAGLLGLGLIGVVVLAVVGFVTDMIPGLGE